MTCSRFTTLLADQFGGELAFVAAFHSVLTETFADHDKSELWLRVLEMIGDESGEAELELSAIIDPENN